MPVLLTVLFLMFSQKACKTVYPFETTHKRHYLFLSQSSQTMASLGPVQLDVHLYKIVNCSATTIMLKVRKIHLYTALKVLYIDVVTA